MLTTKNRAGTPLLAVLLATLIFGAGCGDPGVRALLKGERLLNEGKYEQAVAEFNEATERLPNTAEAWNRLGLALHHAGEHAKAAEAYRKALDLDRNLSAARYNLGCLLLEQNQFAAAADEFTTFSALDRQNTAGWLKLGTAQMRQASRLSGSERLRWLDAARKNIETSLTIGRTAEAYNLLGVIEIQRSRARDAVRAFNSALQKQPNYPPALLNLAVTYHVHLNDPRGALPQYTAFLGTEPPLPEAVKVQEIVHTLERDINPGRINQPGGGTVPPTATARTGTITGVAPTPVHASEPTVQTLKFPRYRYLAPRRAAPGNRNQALPSYEKGSRLQQTGEARSAIEAFRQAVAVDPAFFEAHFRLALAAYAVGDWRTCLEASEHALATKPESTAARYNFALGLEKAGYPQDAATELEKVLLQNPGDARAHLSLANLYAQKLGQRRLAQQHYRKVIELQPQHPEAQAIRHWLQQNP